MHVPVLAGAAIEWLNIRPGGTYVDCTVGAAGHASLIAQRLQNGRLLALDRDPDAVEFARQRLASFSNAVVIQRNYADLLGVLTELGIERVDGVLLDAGLSSTQLDDPARGMSFQLEGPLDMRMDTTQGLTAAQYLAKVEQPELIRVLRTYGDIRAAGRIADAIIHRRVQGTLRSTRDLAECVHEALHFVKGVPEETRTVFQSIRIAVNDELRSLEKGLDGALRALSPGGRLVVITFHSGEDRIAKNVLLTASRPQRLLHPDGRVKEIVPATVRMLTRKPVIPDEDEIRENPRAHSAKLRAVERLADSGGARDAA